MCPCPPCKSCPSNWSVFTQIMKLQKYCCPKHAQAGSVAIDNAAGTGWCEGDCPYPLIHPSLQASHFSCWSVGSALQASWGILWVLQPFLILARHTQATFCAASPICPSYWLTIHLIWILLSLALVSSSLWILCPSASRAPEEPSGPGPELLFNSSGPKVL